MDYFPVRMSACHVCCPPKFTVFVFSPIAFAMQDARLRQRHRIHTVSPDRIFTSLSKYGLTRDMLPTFMGGSIELGDNFDPETAIAGEEDAEGNHGSQLPSELDMFLHSFGAK